MSRPTFGTMLRAWRLGYHFWEEGLVFIRITPVDNRPPAVARFDVVAMDDFTGLRKSTTGELHYCWSDDRENANKMIAQVQKLRDLMQERIASSASLAAALMLPLVKDPLSFLVDDQGRTVYFGE